MALLTRQKYIHSYTNENIDEFDHVEPIIYIPPKTFEILKTPFSHKIVNRRRSIYFSFGFNVFICKQLKIEQGNIPIYKHTFNSVFPK